MLEDILNGLKSGGGSETTTEILYGEEARRELLRGIEEVAKAVGKTMGPKGRRVVIQTSDPTKPIVTKDGVTVSKSICPIDYVHRIGAALVQEAAARTNETSGDGTTTATVLTRELVFLVNRQLTAGFDPNGLEVGMEEAVESIKELLTNKATPADSKETLKQIATVSANGDEWLGGLVADAIHRVGLDGVVSVEDAKGTKTSIEIVEGTRFDRGYVSPYFVNDKEKMRCSYENAYVLITDKKLTSLKDLIPVLEQCVKSNKPLLLICEDIEGEALQGVVLNSAHGKVKMCVVRAPGPDRIEMLKDLATIVGGTHVFSANGDKIEDVKMETLGQCKNFSVDAKSCTIVATGLTADSVVARAEEVRKRLEDPNLQPEEVDLLRLRLSRLTSGAAIIRVGGSTELELNERKHRLEDSLHAAKAALESGVLPGGGISLYKVAQTLRKEEHVKTILSAGDGKSAGWRVVLDACRSPISQIASNAGKNIETIPIDDLEWGFGWDAASDQITNLLSAGIVDPLKVTLSALENSLSVARTFLELDAVVHFEKKDKK